MDRVELAVFESRKKREGLSSAGSFQEEERPQRHAVCLTLVYNPAHISFKNTAGFSF